jgi:DnaJ-domain-containing protein 1
MVAHFDVELEALRHDYRELAAELHRDRYDARSTRPSRSAR